MGHRALVAYERDGDSGYYDTHYSHWGASNLKLRDLITEEDPYADGYVDEEASRSRIDMETVVNEQVDFLMHEAVYVVSADYEVTAYVPMGYDCDIINVDNPGEYFEEEKRGTGRGCLVPVRWYDGEPMSNSEDHGCNAGVRQSAATLAKSGYFDSYEEMIQWSHERNKEMFAEYTNRDGYKGSFMSTEESMPLEYRNGTRRAI